MNTKKTLLFVFWTTKGTQQTYMSVPIGVTHYPFSAEALRKIEKEFQETVGADYVLATNWLELSGLTPPSVEPTNTEERS